MQYDVTGYHTTIHNAVPWQCPHHEGTPSVHTLSLLSILYRTSPVGLWVCSVYSSKAVKVYCATILWTHLLDKMLLESAMISSPPLNVLLEVPGRKGERWQYDYMYLPGLLCAHLTSCICVWFSKLRGCYMYMYISKSNM